MKIQFRAKTSRLVRAKKRLRQAVAILGSAEVSRLVSDELFKDTIQSFASQRSPNGVRWAKPARPLGRPTLIKTGKLLASVGIERSRTSVAITASAPYARYHQKGTANIPARPFLPSAKTAEVTARRTVKNILKKLFG